MSEQSKKRIKQIILIICGTFIQALGLDLAIHAGFGCATLAVFWDGASKLTHLTIGQTSFATAMLMIAFCFFYDRKQISWGTLIYQIIYGLFLDLIEPFLRYFGVPWLDFCLMILGILIMASGTALYSYADFGRGSYEALNFSLADRNHWQPRYVRIGLDVFFVVVGIILGGSFGACTIATILLSGFVMQFVLEQLRKHNFVGICHTESYGSHPPEEAD